MKLVEDPGTAAGPPTADENAEQWQALKDILSPPSGNTLQLTTEENIVYCPTCSKPVVDSVLEAHKALCVASAPLKPSTSQSSADVRKPSLVITLSGSTPAATSTGKRKAAPEPDRNCCVPLPNGGMCPRSLTCKTNSVSSKRAVQRSQPYDVLLAALQALNAPKLSNADAASTSALSKQAAKKRKRAFGEISASSSDEDIDSDLEADNVIEAIKRAGRPNTIEVFYGAGSGWSNKSRWIGRNLKTERMRELLGGLFSAKA